MSNHHTEPQEKKPTNYLLRVALAFVYTLALGCLLHLFVGSQACDHCSKCTACNECTEKSEAETKSQMLWGKEECSGACCKSKDHCTKEHECKEGEKKGDDSTEVKAK